MKKMRLKYFNVYQLIPILFHNLLQGFVRLLALFIKGEHKEDPFPLMEPEVKKTDYSILNKDQIKSLSDHYGMTEEEVIRYSDQLKSTLVFQFDEAQKAVKAIWEQLQPEMVTLVSLYKLYERSLKIKSYRKKKSQFKSWSKWKKRRKNK